jgi:tetratricopeptide (TPR) repeat protein
VDLEVMGFRSWLAVVLASAAALRAVLLLQILDQASRRDVLLLDSRVYEQMADRIAAGDLLAGSEAFSVGPLYAYFVAGLRWLGPDDRGFLYAVQLLLGLATVALVAVIARHCCGSRAAIAAAGSIAFYGAMEMLEVKLMGTTLATFLGVASVALLLFASERRWNLGVALAGLLLGGACLARPNTLLFAPLAIGWWVWAERGRTRGDAGAAQRRGSLAGAAALGCGLVLAIAPATLRNQWVTGEFTLISSQAGITFFHGNNPDAYGLFASGGAISGNPLTQSADQRRIAEQAAGRPLTQSEVGRYWFGRGIEHLASDPIGAAGLFARKLGYWLSSDEVPVGYSLPAERELTPALRLAPVPFGLILAFAFLGLRSSRWRDPPRVLLYLFALANLSSVLVFYFASRYRVPAVPILAVLAGCGVAETLERMQRPRREFLGWVLPGVLVAALSLYTWTDDLRQSALHQFFNYGNIHTRQDEPALAIESYQRALPEFDHVAQLHINLAVAYQMLDEHADAIRHLERALEIQPRAPRVRLALDEERRKLAASGPPAPEPAAGPEAPPASSRSPAAIPLGRRHVERLLVVALDGATWKWMTPLIEQGRLPVLEKLQARGVWASLETLEPTVSPAIWTTVATGTLPERHGIPGFDGVPGQTMETLPNATMRRVKAWWEMLDAAALTSGTIGWWASWPADPLRPGSYLVSDRVAYTRMEAAVGRSALDARDTQPADLIEGIRELVERPNEIDRNEVRRFLKLSDSGIERHLLGAKYVMGRRFPEFKFTYQADRSNWKIARKLIAERPVDLAAVYFSGIDTVSHLFWHFSFPESLVGRTVPRQKVERFRDVIPLYYELMDRYIGDLIEAAGEDTTVMVVSDHGFGATGTLPWSGGHGRRTRGAPIAPPGVLILSGPGIASGGAEIARANVIDIAPTLLALLGLPVAEDMHGRPLIEAFSDGTASEVSQIESWEAVGGPRDPGVVPADPRGDADRIEKFRALGYIE